MIVVTAGVLRKIFSGEPLTRHVGIIPAGGRPKGSKNLAARIDKGQRRRQLHQPRDEEMITMHHDGKTLEEIGQHFNLTRERVRQILALHGLTRLDGGNSTKMFLSAQDRIQKEKELLAKREARIWKQTGMTLDQWQDHVSIYGNDSDKRSPFHKFKNQKNSARHRLIEWRLTFKEWWELWQESGHWHERGPGKSYCMARYGDSGAYAVENVYICTVGENFSDSYIVKPWHERWPSGHPGSHARKGRGWTYISKLKTNPYRAQCAKKYLGQFPTAEAAHAAYLEARRQLLGGNGKARA